MVTTFGSVKVKSAASTLSGNSSVKGQHASPRKRAPIAWKTLVGLVLIFIELWLNTGIIWGGLMLIWAILGVHSGQTYILELLERQKHPVLFWMVIHVWLLFAAFFFMDNARIYGFCQELIFRLGVQ